VARNDSTSERSGTMSVAGQTFTVTQSGLSCSYTISPTTASFNPGGGSSNFVVATEAGCTWTASSSESWITITGNTSGSGAGTVTCSVAANTSSSARSGTIIIAGKSFSISQAAPTASLLPGQLAWVRNMLGSYRLLPAAVAADQANNVIAVGTFTDAAGHQSDLGGGRMPYAAGWTGFLVKYTPQNGFAWAKSLAGGFTAVAVDNQTNILVTGNFSGTVDFGGTTLNSILSPMGTPSSDIFVAKYSATGALMWVKQFGGNNSDGGTAIAVDGSGNVIFGAQYGSASVNFGTGPVSNLGDFDIAIVKLSGTTGATLWAKGMGSTGYDNPNSVAVDGSGDVVLTGKAGGSINLGGGAVGSGGIIIGKYSGSDGSYKWAKALGGVAGNGIATDLRTGNIFVTGQSSSIFLNAYDSVGNPLWAKTFGGSADAGKSVSVDASGNVGFTGNASSLLDFAGTGSYLTGGSYYVASFSTTGVYQWAKRPSPNGGVGTGIAFDSAGHLITTGNFYNTANFGEFSITATSGVTDGFVVQYNK
jgi:hypothetical protein